VTTANLVLENRHLMMSLDNADLFHTIILHERTPMDQVIKNPLLFLYYTTERSTLDTLGGAGGAR
jgi:hypothetical protein